MYIIKERDERKIELVAELVGERSEKLLDTVKTIQALKRQERLDVETIEQAIEIVNEKKKWTDLLDCRFVDLYHESSVKKFEANFVSWGVTNRKINKCHGWGIAWSGTPARLNMRKSYIGPKSSFISKKAVTCTVHM